MFIQYDPNVKASISFLNRLGVKVNNATVNDTLQNHPDWPSLLCITDSLNKWNIPNGAGKTDPEKIDELPTPFIAYTNDRENPLAIVSKANGKTIETYQKNYNKPAIENKDDFIKKWNGVYVIAEPGKHSGENNYEVNKRKFLLNSLIPVAAFVLLIILSLFFVNRTVNAALASSSLSITGIYLQYFILLAGVIVASLLLWYEIDKSNPLLQKVCTGITKGNCNAILTGKQSKLFSWLSWSEVGFFYFTGGLLTLLFAGNSITSSITILAWLNLLALPYVVFSIYYQWRVAKQWCVLCLAVQALLLLGGMNVVINNFLFPFPILSVSLITIIIFFYLLTVLTWYAVKPLVLKLQESKNTKREYLRIKFNNEIFDTLLKKQKAITISPDGLGIDLGNSSAANTLVKVCNPYCGPCGKAHPKIEELLEENANVKAKIIFTTSNDEADRAIKPTRHLMAIAEDGNNEKIKQSLDDWYLADKKDYEVFASKYQENGELEKQGDKIEAMDKWCHSMDIHATPTIFLNGYQLPDAYSIEDIRYFLL